MVLTSSLLSQRVWSAFLIPLGTTCQNYFYQEISKDFHLVLELDILTFRVGLETFSINSGGKTFSCRGVSWGLSWSSVISLENNLS